MTAMLCLNPDAVRLFQRMDSVLFMDCTYRTNQYNLPLLHILGMAGSNHGFTIGIALLTQETIPFYRNVLQIDIPDWYLKRINDKYRKHPKHLRNCQHEKDGWLNESEPCALDKFHCLARDCDFTDTVNDANTRAEAKASWVRHTLLSKCPGEIQIDDWRYPACGHRDGPVSV